MSTYVFSTLEEKNALSLLICTLFTGQTSKEGILCATAIITREKR